MDINEGMKSVIFIFEQMQCWLQEESGFSGCQIHGRCLAGAIIETRDIQRFSRNFLNVMCIYSEFFFQRCSVNKRIKAIMDYCKRSKEILYFCG